MKYETLDAGFSCFSTTTNYSVVAELINDDNQGVWLEIGPATDDFVRVEIRTEMRFVSRMNVWYGLNE